MTGDITPEGTSSAVTPQVGKSRRKRLVRRMLVAAVLLIAGLAVDYFAYSYGRWKTAPAADRGENGLWLRYTWAFGRKSEQEVKDLAARLRDARVRYAYFHVRHLRPDGTLAYRKPVEYRALVRTLRRRAPSVKLLAWVYAGPHFGEGKPALTDPPVRRRMVAAADWLVRECGFDGVQWDIEPSFEAEPGIVDLLREARAVLPRGALLSVAAPVNYPWPLHRLGWSAEFFAEVAAECDQLCIMAYDTGFLTPRGYAWFVRRQVAVAAPAVERGSRTCRLLIGVPTYGKGLPSHNPRAENLRIALKAVRDGAATLTEGRGSIAGVALFADYTTQDAEWRVFEDLWLGR
jgi:hypothetical protein